ncbi:DUF6585 family protein [Nonomuraea sp. NPDC050536]|uniref:DUF6585 family protein n=1 Tax=Nonomuraea sp. NPDC050536 TaxID=3364366 RepID=UPI0037C54095
MVALWTGLVKVRAEAEGQGLGAVERWLSTGFHYWDWRRFLLGAFMLFCAVVVGTGEALYMPLLAGGSAVLAWAILPRVLSIGRRLYVCERGLVETRIGRVYVLPLERITGIRRAVTELYINGAHHATAHAVTVETVDRGRFTYDNRFRNIEDLADILQQKVVNDYLLPLLVKRFVAGETVAFGPLSVSPEGIVRKRKLLPWDELDGTPITQGRLTLHKKNTLFSSWANHHTYDVPNLTIFLAIVHTAAGWSPSPDR